MTTFSLLLVLFLSVNGLVVASAQTLPGDALYAVKRAAETVRLQLVSDTEIKHRMEDDYILRRSAEVKRLLALQRVEHITLEGRVDHIQDQRWIVEGIPVALSTATRLIGNIQPGDFIEVEGVTNPSGWVDADELHLRYFNLVGVVQSISRSTWTIGGVQLIIQKDTQFDPGLQIGNQALVLVYSSDDGKFYARAILNHNPAPFQPFEIQFNGTLESIDGQALTIAGRRVESNAQTVFEGNIVPGIQVNVVSRVEQDGTLTALSVSVLEILAPEPASNDDSNRDVESGVIGDDTQSGEEDDDLAKEDGKDDGQDGDEKDDEHDDGDDKDNAEDDDKEEDDDGDDDDKEDGQDDDDGDGDDDDEDDGDEDKDDDKEDGDDGDDRAD